MKIGILDSGLAGLVTTRYLVQSCSENHFVYFGDTAHMPYDSRSPELIRHRALKGAHVLMQENVEVMVISCPAISSAAAESVHEATGIPVLDFITPQADVAVHKSRRGRIGILSSKAVVDSRVYNHKIHANDPSVKTYSTSCPLLAHLVENGWAQRPETRMIVKKCLYPLKIRQIDTLILGSNHAIFMAKLIQAKIGKRVLLVDPLQQFSQTIENLGSDRPKNQALVATSKRIRVLVSDITDHNQSLSAIFLKQRIPLESAMV